MYTMNIIRNQSLINLIPTYITFHYNDDPLAAKVHRVQNVFSSSIKQSENFTEHHCLKA